MAPSSPKTPRHPSDKRKESTPKRRKPRDHEGATEAQVGERTGSGAGYDLDPTKVRDDGGVES